MNKHLIFLIVLFFLLIIQKDTEKDNKNMDEEIKTLVRQASRWSSAAKQDENPMIAVLHSNYGAGFLWALKDIATQTQIESATGIKLLEFEKEITSAQDSAIKKMVAVCPDFQPDKSFLSTLAGER